MQIVTLLLMGKSIFTCRSCQYILFELFASLPRVKNGPIDVDHPCVGMCFCCPVLPKVKKRAGEQQGDSHSMAMNLLLRYQCVTSIESFLSHYIRLDFCAHHFCPKRKMVTFSQAHSHALTNATGRHEYFQGLSRLLARSFGVIS